MERPSMDMGRRHWLAAFAAALAIHLLVGGLWLWQAPQSGAVGAGLGGVAVSLGPAGGAPGALASASDATSEAAEVTTAEAVEEPTPETLEATPPEPEVAETPPEPTVEPRVEPTVEPAPETPAPETPSLAADPVEPEPEREVAPEVTPDVTEAVEAEPMQTAAVVPRAVPAPPKPRDLPRAPLPAPEPTAQAAAVPEGPPASAPGAGGRSGTQAAPEAGSGEAASGGGRPGASADYLALLQAWLEKHKEYPRRAQARRQEGTVLLRFEMDRDGRVLDYGIQQSSGHGLLDREVEAMIRRAEPLPPLPDEMAQARLELVIPVQFLLR